jgi:hypothetical protein
MNVVIWLAIIHTFPSYITKNSFERSNYFVATPDRTRNFSPSVVFFFLIGDLRKSRECLSKLVTICSGDGELNRFPSSQNTERMKLTMGEMKVWIK